jgi:LacI family transcriptional regulator
MRPPETGRQGIKGEKKVMNKGEQTTSHATMADVARVAGVSLKSVSRVINKEPHVSPHLREKVEAAIRNLHYVPDTAARSLAGARSFTIGLLFDNPSPNYTMKVLSGAYRACIERQYHLRVDNLSASGDEETVESQIEAILRNSRCDGFILTPPLTDNRQVLDMLEARRVPYVRMAPMLERERSKGVYTDDRGGAARVAELFYELGHRHIAILNGPDSHGAAHDRREGFLGRLKELAPDLVVAEALGGFEFEQGREGARQLLSAAQRPTAIFATNDDSAAGAIGVCNQMGLRVPEDISVCGFDDSWVAKIVWPYLTTIHQPIEDMGYAAAELLLDRSGTAEKQAERHLPYSLVMRDSVAKAP